MRYFVCQVSDDFTIGGRHRFKAIDTKKMIEVEAVEVMEKTYWREHGTDNTTGQVKSDNSGEADKV
jgi:hypothetical protein